MINFDKDQPRQLQQKTVGRRVPAPTPKTAATATQDGEVEQLQFTEVAIGDSAWRGSPRAVSKVNDAMMLILATFLFLIPMPYGANNSTSWLAATVFLSLCAIGYIVMVLALDPHRPSQLRQHRGILVLGAVVLLTTGLQLLPVAPTLDLVLPDGVMPQHLTFNTHATFLALIRLSSYAILFALMLEVFTNQMRIERMLRLIYLGIVAHAIWALLSLSFFGDTLLLGEKVAYKGFATGTFVNRNSFATFMALGATIGAGRVLMAMRGPRGRSPRRRSSYQGLTVEAVVQLGWLAIILAALLASGSRMGVAVALLGMFVVSVLILVKTGMAAWKAAGGFLALLFLLLVASLVLGGGVTLERAVYAFVDSGIRIELYQQTWQMIMSAPLLGHGVDSYDLVFELYHQPELRPEVTWEMPHNTILTLWAEYGIPLGSVTLLIILVAFVASFRALVRRELAYFPAAVSVAAIVLTAAHSLVDFSLEIAGNVYIFVALVALGLAKRSFARGQI